MKTKIDGFNIDLREVVAIGPLRASSATGHGCRFGCSVWLFGRNEAFWFNMADDPVDPYQLDDAKNTLVRATAQANYNTLVTQWLAVD